MSTSTLRARNTSDDTRACALEMHWAAHSQGSATIVTAPAGFGKTRLLQILRARLDARGQAVFSHSLRDPEAGLKGQRFFDAGSEAPVVLLLDDFDAAPTSAHAAVMVSAFEQASSGCHIVVAVRSTNAAPTARLRTQSALVFGPEHLRIRRGEFAAHFERRVGSRLARVWSLTEGWPAAAEILARHIEQTRDLPSNSALVHLTGIGDYIEQQVVAMFTCEQRLALAYASVMASRSRDALDAMADDQDAGRHLVSAMRALGGLAQIETPMRLNPIMQLWAAQLFDELPRPHRDRVIERAADIAAANGNVAEAAQLAVRCGKPEKTTTYVRQAGGVRLFVIASIEQSRPPRRYQRETALPRQPFLIGGFGTRLALCCSLLRLTADFRRP